MASLNSLNRDESQTALCTHTSAPPIPIRMGTVLLVDDEPFILRVLARTLEGSPYNVERCHKPSQALEFVLHNDVALVVSDISMPEMSGLDLLCAIHEFDPALPVVLMTGCSDPDSVMQALESGASEYLIKPFDISKFKQTVQRHARAPKCCGENGPVNMSAGG